MFVRQHDAGSTYTGIQRWGFQGIEFLNVSLEAAHHCWGGRRVDALIGIALLTTE